MCWFVSVALYRSGLVLKDRVELNHQPIEKLGLHVKSETELTASVLKKKKKKEIQNTQEVKQNAFNWTKLEIIYN